MYRRSVALCRYVKIDNEHVVLLTFKSFEVINNRLIKNVKLSIFRFTLSFILNPTLCSCFSPSLYWHPR